eukprot:17845-Heterococcus_DN1.PRE.12
MKHVSPLHHRSTGATRAQHVWCQDIEGLSYLLCLNTTSMHLYVGLISTVTLSSAFYSCANCGAQNEVFAGTCKHMP